VKADAARAPDAPLFERLSEDGEAMTVPQARTLLKSGLAVSRHATRCRVSYTSVKRPRPFVRNGPSEVPQRRARRQVGMAFHFAANAGAPISSSGLLRAFLSAPCAGRWKSASYYW